MRPSIGQETSREPTGSPAPEPEKPGLDPLELLRYALGAARRHWQLGCVVALLVGSLGVIVAATVPSVYESTSKIFDTRSTDITATVAGARHGDERDTMRGVREFVMSRENLLSIARETKLLESWEATRPWPLRWKDKLQAAVLGPLTDREKERALLELLEKAVSVEIEDNSSIRFRVQWRDPELAFRMTELAQRNLLRMRGDASIQAVSRGVVLLEDELRRAEAAIDPAVSEVARLLEKVRAEAAAQRQATSRAPRRVATLAAIPHDAGMGAGAPPSDLAERLEELRRAERELLEPWQRHNAELKLRLAELRSVYGPEHPLVRQQEAKLSAAAAAPPELADIKQRQQALMASVAALSSQPSVPQPSATPSPVHAITALPHASSEREPEAPEVAAARARLESALGKVRELNERLDAARLEIASESASAGHRYVVVQAAEFARKPIKPKRPLLYAGAVVLALLLGLLAGAARELASGRMMASWQVRALGLEVLAEVRLDPSLRIASEDPRSTTHSYRPSRP